MREGRKLDYGEFFGLPQETFETHELVSARRFKALKAVQEEVELEPIVLSGQVLSKSFIILF